MSLNQESIISTLQKTIENYEKIKKQQEDKIEELEEIINWVKENNLLEKQENNNNKIWVFLDEINTCNSKKK